MFRVPSPLWGGLGWGSLLIRSICIERNSKLNFQTPPDPHPNPPHKGEGEEPSMKRFFVILGVLILLVPVGLLVLLQVQATQAKNFVEQKLTAKILSEFRRNDSQMVNADVSNVFDLGLDRPNFVNQLQASGFDCPQNVQTDTSTQECHGYIRRDFDCVNSLRVVGSFDEISRLRKTKAHIDYDCF
jgi:hypothetical protein